MSSAVIKCGDCRKSIPKHLRVINCDTCKQFFHVKCCGVIHKIFNFLKTSDSQWNCKSCEEVIRVNNPLNLSCNTDDIGNNLNTNNCVKNTSICG